MILECKKCGIKIDVILDEAKLFKLCPKCGIKLTIEENK